MSAALRRKHLGAAPAAAPLVMRALHLHAAQPRTSCGSASLMARRSCSSNSLAASLQSTSASSSWFSTSWQSVSTAICSGVRPCARSRHQHQQQQQVRGCACSIGDLACISAEAQHWCSASSRCSCAPHLQVAPGAVVAGLAGRVQPRAAHHQLHDQLGALELQRKQQRRHAALQAAAAPASAGSMCASATRSCSEAARRLRGQLQCTRAGQRTQHSAAHSTLCCAAR